MLHVLIEAIEKRLRILGTLVTITLEQLLPKSVKQEQDLEEIENHY